MRIICLSVLFFTQLDKNNLQANLSLIPYNVQNISLKKSEPKN